MELSISAKSQPLNLISCTQLSTLSSAKSIRSEFLGWGHYLRPPGGPPCLLLSRRSKCRNLRFQRTRSKRFLINASLNSYSVIVVVAAATVSALTFAYLNHFLNKKKQKDKSSKEVSGSPSFSLTQLGRNIVNHIIGIRFLDIADIHRDAQVAQRMDVVEKVGQNSIAFEGQEGCIQFQETHLMRESSLLVQPTQSPGANFLPFHLACNYVVSNESEAAVLSPPPLVLADSSDVIPPAMATDMSELTLEKGTKESGFDAKFPELMVQMKSNTTSVAVNNESGEKGNLLSYSGIVQDSVREDLPKFYGANQSVVKSTTNLNGLKDSSSCVFPLNGNSFSLLKVNSTQKGAELSSQQSLHASENDNRTVPVSHCEGTSFQENNNLGRSGGLPRDQEERHMKKDNHNKLQQLPYPIGIDAIDKDQPLKQFNDYNRLLRDGRLAECVDLLEDMERSGLLDMNKVYHAKFFKICKTQKAVEEAFRFCKLVPNPTLSTFNMLMSVCASSQDSEGAFQVLQLSQEAGLKADCKLYTTLISTCAKSGEVDAMFEVFHEMVNAGVEPNIHTYGALIDGCARAGQVAKAFGAYGIMRSKKVKPDRVVFNVLITACGQSGAVDRAFDVLSEMRAEARPIDPDHITVGALMKACASAGQVDRAKEVYNMVHKYKIKGTSELYTIALHCCSQTGDWEFARRIYDDMTRKGVVPDEVFFSALIDVAGHSGKVDVAFEIIRETRIQGTRLGSIPYSSLMGACCNAKNWQKALELYEDIKSIKLNPTVSTMNALITALCGGDQLQKAIEILSEMRSFGLSPNIITYSVLFVASERKDDLKVGLMLLSQAKDDNVAPTLVMYKCIIGMCMRRFKKACILGEPVLSFHSGRPQIENEWTSLALRVYRQIIASGETPTTEVFSQVLGFLKLPCDASLKDKLSENLAVTPYSSRWSNLCSLVDGFGEYDPRAFSLIEEAASFGIVHCVSFKESPIIIDAKNMQIHTAEVYVLTILKGLKFRLAAGAQLPNVAIILPIEKAQIMTSEGEKSINLAGRIGQAVASLLRRLGLPYQGSESYGRIRINGISLQKWFQPKLAFPFSGEPYEFNSFQSRIGKGIKHQQRNIRTGDFSLE